MRAGPGRRTGFRPHRLEAQDTALSRRRRGFDSPWGRQLAGIHPPDCVKRSGWDHRIPGIAGILGPRRTVGRPRAASPRSREARDAGKRAGPGRGLRVVRFNLRDGIIFDFRSVSRIRLEFGFCEEFAKLLVRGRIQAFPDAFGGTKHSIRPVPFPVSGGPGRPPALRCRDRVPALGFRRCAGRLVSTPSHNRGTVAPVGLVLADGYPLQAGAHVNGGQSPWRGHGRACPLRCE